MINATVSNTLPGPEPGGPRPTGSIARRNTLATGAARPAAGTSAMGRGVRRGGDDGFAASLDASLDDARRPGAGDDMRRADRPSTGRPAGDDGQTRRATAQPWWVRAQAERPGVPDADPDADDPATARVAGETDDAATTDTTADAGRGAGVTTNEGALAAQMAAQAALAAQATMPAADPATTPDPDAPLGEGPASEAVTGAPGPQAALAVAPAVMTPALTSGTSTAPFAQAGPHDDALQAPAEGTPVAETAAPHDASLNDRLAGEASTGLATPPATAAGMTSGPVSGAAPGSTTGATALAGSAVDARAAARAILSTALGDAAAQSGVSTGTDPSGQATAATAAAQGVAAASVPTAGVAAGTGSQTSDPDSRDARPEGSDTVVELGAKAPTTAGGPATIWVAPPAIGALDPATTFTVPLTDAPMAGDIPEAADNLGRLIQSFRMQMRDGLSEATVRLNPNHLGEVTIAVRVDKGIVSATVQAETGSVRQWLQGQEDALRSTLAEQGLTLEHYAVEPDGQRRQQASDQDPQAQARRRARARQADSRTFEVIA